MAREKPQVLKGFRDFLPEQALARQHVQNTIRRVFESFGFDPVETPVLEYASVLLGKYGPEAQKLFYTFEDRGGRQVAMRYDLTVPGARVIAAHQDLPRPFKRYQIGTVWRQEQPQKGRYREFTQCDVDIAGAPAPSADAEITAVMYAVYQALGLSDVRLRLNHRGILVGIARAAGVPDDLRVNAFRSIDKLDKIPPEAALDEMEGAGVPRPAGQKLLEIIQLPTNNTQAIASYLAGDEEARAAVAQLQSTLDLARAMGTPPENLVIDLSLARGLDYYTGLILEAMLPELRSSVGGGGRYDDLIGQFGGAPVPSVGASVGLDRIMDVLADRHILPGPRASARALVTVFSPDLRPASLALAAEIRAAGIPVETYLLDAPLRKQLTYADVRGVPYAVVMGPDEMKSGAVSIRNLALREQSVIPRADLVDRLTRASSPDDAASASSTPEPSCG